MRSYLEEMNTRTGTEPRLPPRTGMPQPGSPTTSVLQLRMMAKGSTTLKDQPSMQYAESSHPLIGEITRTRPTL